MLEFRKYHADDLPKCLELLQVGHAPTFSLERFRWLHEQPPGGASEITVCTNGNDIIGLYSVIRKTVCLGQNTYQGGRDVDPVVHPDFRGRGIFTRLLEFGLNNFQNLDFCFNFANPISAPGFRKAGWQDVGTLDDRAFQIGFKSIFSAKFIAWLATGALLHRDSTDDAREITQVEAFQVLDEISAHAAHWLYSDHLCVERSTAYLRWRYALNPLKKEYRWFIRGSFHNPLGLAVCSFDKDLNRLSVLDALGFSAPPKLKYWLGCWARSFPGCWVGVWSSVPAEICEGFIANPLGRGKGCAFLVRSFPGREVPKGLFKMEGWYITRGDLEVM